MNTDAFALSIRHRLLLQGSAPTVSVDNATGCQLYLNKDSLKTAITTAKSSEINVMVPGASPDGDWVCLSSLCNHDNLLIRNIS